MLYRKTQFPSPRIVALAFALFVAPTLTLAQHGGGGGGINASHPGAGGGRPSGVSEKDDLKDFHRILALQATADQRAAFVKIAQSLQEATDQLQAFRESLPKAPASSALSERATAVNQALEKARAGNQKFLASFSPAQESGLKDLTKKLAKADSDLDKQARNFDQAAHAAKPESEQLADAAALEKTLASFQAEHLSLGKEMSILLPTNGQELVFNLPRVIDTIKAAGQTISIPVSGVVSHTSSGISSGAPAANVHNPLSLSLTADLADLQQNIVAVLRSQLPRTPRCGERLEVQQATLTPLVPASLVAANVHYERWVCPVGQNAMEVFDGDAEIEIKLTPSVDPKSGLVLASELGRVAANGSLRDALRTGDLGVAFRDQVAAALLTALQKTADLNTILPPAARQSAVLQKVEFQTSGPNQLTLVLEGQLQLSEEQIAQSQAQLKQQQSAQAPSAP